MLSKRTAEDNFGALLWGHKVSGLIFTPRYFDERNVYCVVRIVIVVRLTAWFRARRARVSM